MRTKFTSTAPDGTSVTQYTYQGAGMPTSTTYQDSEKHLFAFPARLVGENLLKVAETRSNQKISDEIAAAQKGPVAYHSNLTAAAVASRIRKAIQIRAEKTGVTVNQAQDAFGAIRKANDIRVFKAGLTRAGKSAAAVEEGSEKKEDSSDSELSELETDTEQ